MKKVRDIYARILLLCGFLMISKRKCIIETMNKIVIKILLNNT